MDYKTCVFTIEACDNALGMLAEDHLVCEVSAVRRRLAAQTKIIHAIRNAAATADISFEDIINLVERLRATTDGIRENAQSA